MFFKEYSNPKGTGWKGWIETSRGETVGFIRLNGEILWKQESYGWK